MLLWEAAHVYSACNLCLQKLLHLQLFGMSTTSLNPNGARDNSMMFMIFLNFHFKCQELKIYATNYITVAKKKKKKDLTYFLFCSPHFSAGAKPACVTAGPQLYVYQRSKVYVS